MALINYALVGSPIEHSPSPAMHNAAFETLKMNAEYRLRSADEEAAELVLAEIRHGKWSGINITTPLKTVFAPMVQLQGHAVRANAVNTLWRYGSEVHGALTDVDGVMLPLQEVGFEEKKSALILGAGGAARAAAIALDNLGTKIHVAARNPHKANEFLNLMEVQNPGTTGALKDKEFLQKLIASVGCVIQATPIGLNGESHQLPWEAAKPNLVAFDMIYKPVETPFLKGAADAGCTTIAGWKMLLAQGAASLKIWTGREAPVDAMENALKAELGIK